MFIENDSGNSLIPKVNKLYDEGRWIEAAELLKGGIDKDSSIDNVDLRISVGVLYRRSGSSDESIDYVTRSLEKYVGNEKLLVFLQVAYEIKGDWTMSGKVAKDLIAQNPSDYKYYFSLGKSCAYLGNFDGAKAAFSSGLKIVHGIEIGDLGDRVFESTGMAGDSVETEYSFLGGRSNLGCFIHNVDGKRLVTKISPLTDRSASEGDFYSNIASSGALKSITPNFYSTLELDDILYITMEMVDLRPVPKGSVRDVIDVSVDISNVPYRNSFDQFRQGIGPVLLGRPTSANKLFLQIDKRIANRKLIYSLEKLITGSGGTVRSLEALGKLKALIMNNRMYNHLAPNTHFGLVHGDFNIENVQMGGSGDIYVIDWESYVYGPRFMGIARYLSSGGFRYSVVRRDYVYGMIEGGKASVVEQIFFLYAYIVYYLVEDGGRSDDLLDKYINPALKDMESLFNTFKESSAAVDFSYINSYEDSQDSLILSQQKEIDKLKVLYSGVVNSVSWKITSPLRKLSGILRRKPKN